MGKRTYSPPRCKRRCRIPGTYGHVRCMLPDMHGPKHVALFADDRVLTVEWFSTQREAANDARRRDELMKRPTPEKEVPRA